MRIHESAMPGVFRIEPHQFRDARGAFFEAFRVDALAEAAGVEFVPRQINYSVSRRNTLRGIHSVTLPPGQAKFVTCVRGSLRDFVVDLRIGSPTFGQHESTVLDAASGGCVYIPEGVGHGFVALTDDTCICYVVSTTYVPGSQINIDPMDPDLAVPWGCADPVMSDADRAAISLSDAMAQGILAHWRDVSPPQRLSR
ncbi:dTDP-4-dehydrorhamnose 3,5-epimerase family protein [Krasilnikovia sp. MM14-A1004]|uniref:dTDP-4-dehydrorhamnose 3,5-epimerase family protein n=1 Tax=Krasilnikovia sp. MM14-A1004 TaxID=3373541 RepID=UPI00399CEEE4